MISTLAKLPNTKLWPGVSKTPGSSKALTRIANDEGFRDWSALSPAIAIDRPHTWNVGERIAGRYLVQHFAATVLSSEHLRPGWYRLVLNLEKAVDVARFESFSNRRKQSASRLGREVIP